VIDLCCSLAYSLLLRLGKQGVVCSFSQFIGYFLESMREYVIAAFLAGAGRFGFARGCFLFRTRRFGGSALPLALFPMDKPEDIDANERIWRVGIDIDPTTLPHGIGL